jgi:uncharacterized circularly permuted ATP-grasp superfamily protein/uncharacterized alpha-E superfamily protein
MAVTNEASRPAAPNLSSLIGGYRAQAGLYDEMIQPDGQVRPHWRPFLEGLAGLDRAELEGRFGVADRHLRDSGVFFRVYDESGAGERPWPLSHVPLLISAEDWKEIRAGVLQRTALLESVLADCYGPRQFVDRGWLPAAAVAGSPEYIRPLVGAVPVGMRHLAFYAVDLGRSPSGDWWVIRDRAQAPSGAGYTLENRAAVTRALGDIYRGFAVERLASFFEAYRGWLSGFRQADDAGVCLLTPGRHNETYFEHAYLARQLGLRLVEGDDLTVRDQVVYLRTIAGLRRVSALWRRLDSDFCDPLELNQRSRLGVPGLVQAVRRRNVMVANAIGTGLAEAEALMSFMPSLAKRLLDQPLALPNVATWWCGQADERNYVLEHFDELAIAPAFAARVPGGLASGGMAVSEMDQARRQTLRAELGRRGIDYVGQEVVKLSTTPVWNDGRLEPRPFMLRVFVAATADGWNVMPGGFGLIGDRIDARAVTMQGGARSADVWVLGEGPHAHPPLPPPAVETSIRRATGALPSRAADNLFWLARYLERAEATLRVVRAQASRLVEGSKGPETATLAEVLFKWGAVPANGGAGGPAARIAAAAALNGEGQGAVPTLVNAVRNAAAVIRDRFPRDALQAIDDLNALVHSPPPDAAVEGRILDRANEALRLIAAVSGIELEGMNRLSGWRFFQLGRRIERAINTSRLARHFAGREAAPESLETLLELAESLRTFRVRYLVGPQRAPVLDLVLLDESNPRSLGFGLVEVLGHLATLPNPRPDGGPSPVIAAAEALVGEVRALDPTSVTDEQLIALENELMNLSNLVVQAYVTFRRPEGAR